MVAFIIKPQRGPQEQFLSTAADIAIFGGAAGGGKSYALLIEPIRHIATSKGFGCVVFRRNATQIRNEGGLWATSSEIYPYASGRPRESRNEWLFEPHGNRTSFAHLEYEKDVLSWQGAQIPLIGFDELTHFTEKQFWYMVSRNRSTSAVRPYIRATTNPDPDSWVRRFVDWWIGADGFPVPERAAKVRWFVRVNDELVWDDDPRDLERRYPMSIAKSATFIPAKLDDNPALVQRDPGYRANLMALSAVDRARLLDGNWNARAVAGELFKASWFATLSITPTDVVKWVRYWDRAATEPSTSNPDPDYTVGVLMGMRADRSVVIADVARDRLTPGGVEQMLRRVAQQDARDYPGVTQWQQTDPGQAGKVERHHLSRALASFDVRFDPVPRSSKIERAKTFSAQTEAGNVALVRGAWLPAFVAEAEQFPQGGHDDQVDAASGALSKLTSKIVDSIEAWQ